jgi:hypothetical protein
VVAVSLLAAGTVSMAAPAHASVAAAPAPTSAVAADPAGFEEAFYRGDD